MLTNIEILVLRSVEIGSGSDLRRVTERWRQKLIDLRQKLIDLGMREPPLVDVDADRVSITAAGRAELDRQYGHLF